MRPSRHHIAAVAVWIAVLVMSGVLVLRPDTSPTHPMQAAADPRPAVTTLPLPTTTAPPTTVAPTTVAPTTVAPATTAPPPPPVTVQAAQVPVRSLAPYGGLGTWIDVYDWSTTFNRGTQRVELADIDRMAASGVQTLYVQTSKWDAPTDVLEPERLLPMIQRAKAKGMHVVAWYLPTFVNPQADMGRLMAASRIPGVDALAVDVESRTLADVTERNRRLLEISTNLRAALPGMTLGAIPFPPVVTEVINPKLWPRFPWRALAPLYDVWLPMSYQSDRKAASGYRDAYRYTAENIDRMRARLGRPNVPVHTIGGIADQTSTSDVAAMLRAAQQRKVVGGSLYDWRTTSAELWAALQAFRG
ncbi:MAG: hypothetical protein JWN29_246 [Acidimicrobiales bacterium]|nr:hypothetical protein [Acidimicrobiales bacterium]